MTFTKYVYRYVTKAKQKFLALHLLNLTFSLSKQARCWRASLLPSINGSLTHQKKMTLSRWDTNQTFICSFSHKYRLVLEGIKLQYNVKIFSCLLLMACLLCLNVLRFCSWLLNYMVKPNLKKILEKLSKKMERIIIKKAFISCSSQKYIHTASNWLSGCAVTQ